MPPRGVSRLIPREQLPTCPQRLLLAQWSTAALLLALTSCAGGPASTEAPRPPAYREYSAQLQALSAATSAAVAASRHDLELNVRRSSRARLVTFQRPLPLRQLKALAHKRRPGGLRGKALSANLQVQLSLSPARGSPDGYRLTIRPVFMVYTSAWGDQRQWIEWRSNGALEQELFGLVESQLEGGG